MKLSVIIFTFAILASLSVIVLTFAILASNIAFSKAMNATAPTPMAEMMSASEMMGDKTMAVSPSSAMDQNAIAPTPMAEIMSTSEMMGDKTMAVSPSSAMDSTRTSSVRTMM